MLGDCCHPQSAVNVETVAPVEWLEVVVVPPAHVNSSGSGPAA